LYYTIEQNTTLTITTNWDRMLWNDKNVKNLIQLHGLSPSSDQPEIVAQSIVLPTELKTDYQQLHFLRGESIKSCNQFVQIKEDIAYRAEVLFDVEKASQLPFKEPDLTKDLKKIILAGIKLNDYDVELIEILNYIKQRLNEQKIKLEQVEIFNPNDKDAKRASILLDRIAQRVIQKFEKTRIIYEEPQ
jgi:hypothetical protein